MTIEEKNRLRDIVREKYLNLEGQSRSVAEREESWNLLCDGLGIRRMSKLIHLCAPPEPDEVRVEEPHGGFLGMSLETAKKILLIGL